MAYSIGNKDGATCCVKIFKPFNKNESRIYVKEQETLADFDKMPIGANVRMALPKLVTLLDGSGMRALVTQDVGKCLNEMDVNQVEPENFIPPVQGLKVLHVRGRHHRDLNTHQLDRLGRRPSRPLRASADD